MSYSILLNIVDAPKNIKMSPSGTIEASAGDDVSFNCLAEGRPLPFVLIRKQKDQVDRE